MSISTSPGTGTGTPASSISRNTNAANRPCRSRNEPIARLISVHQSTTPDDSFLTSLYDVSIPERARSIGDRHRRDEDGRRGRFRGRRGLVFRPHRHLALG